MKKVLILLILLSLFTLSACLPQSKESLEKELTEDIDNSSSSLSIEESTSSSSKSFLHEDLDYGNLGDAADVASSNENPDKTSDSIQADHEEQIESPSQEQKEMVISWVYQATEDYDKKLAYNGTDQWNVALNYIDNKNKWIVTTVDRKYGKVKAIFEWSGDDDSDGFLKFLLVKGETLFDVQ